MTTSDTNRERSKSGLVKRLRLLSGDLRAPILGIRIAALGAVVAVLCAPGFGSDATLRVDRAAASRNYELVSLLAELAALAIGAWALVTIVRGREWARPRRRSLALAAVGTGVAATLALVAIDFATLPTLSAPTNAPAMASDRHDLQHGVAYPLLVLLGLGLVLVPALIARARRAIPLGEALGPLVPLLAGAIAALGLVTGARALAVAGFVLLVAVAGELERPLLGQWLERRVPRLAGHGRGSLATLREQPPGSALARLRITHRWVDPVLAAIPAALFLAPVFAAIFNSFHTLSVLHNPALGDVGTQINSDAEALFNGHSLYVDPETPHYTGGIYGPGLPAVLALIYHLDYWMGWAPIVTIAAALGIFLLVSAVALRPTGRYKLDWIPGGMEALGIGALAWWMLTSLQNDELYEPRADQFAWFFGLFGLTAVAVAAHRKRPGRALALAIVLLTIAVWSKQSLIVASAAAVVFLWLSVAAGEVRAKVAAWFTGALVAVNAAILVVLLVLTHGWVFFYLTMGSKLGQTDIGTTWHERLINVGAEFVSSSALMLLFALTMTILVALAALWARRGTNAPRLTPWRSLLRFLPGTTWRGRLGVAVALLLVFAAAEAAYVRRYTGLDDNEYIGINWTLAILGALAYRRTRMYMATAPVAAAVLLGLLALGQPNVLSKFHIGTVQFLAPPERNNSQSWDEVPPALVKYAASHKIYHPTYSDLNAKTQGFVYQGTFNFMNIVSAGERPDYLVDWIVNRRFDAVVKPPEDKDSFIGSNPLGEQNFIWKLDKVIDAKYMPAPQLGPDVLVRRPGPDPARWMNSCFGPFKISGVDFRIIEGGGFWCQSGDRLMLRETPAPVSVVRSKEDVALLGGSVAVSMPQIPSSGWFNVSLSGTDGRLWIVHGDFFRRRLAIVLLGAGKGYAAGESRALTDRVPIRLGRDNGLRIGFAPGQSANPAITSSARGAVRFDLPSLGSAQFSLATTQNTHLTFDLAKLRLQPR